MIKKLISKSRITEVNAVANRINGAFNKSSLSSDSHLSGFATELKQKNAVLQLAINRFKTESVLDETDEIRDYRVRSLGYYLQGNLYNPDASIKAASEKIYKLFNNYGIAIATESYAIESSYINSLLSDLSDTKLQDSIVAIPGCSVLIQELADIQQNFESTRITYEEEKASERVLENASSLKAEVLAIINSKLVVYLRAMEMVDTNSYGAFASTVNQIIIDNNEIVKKRTQKLEVVE